jgi:predicted RNA binding protein YcfA (HicA-like mRNA interferase family)
MMFSELRRILAKQDWKITHGKKHDQATNSNFPGVKIPIGRHKDEVPKGILSNILKDAGLK